MLAGDAQLESETLDVRIPSEVRHIEVVVAEVVLRCQAWHFSRRQVALNVPVALTEALSNAILRGNREDPSKSVRVRGEVNARQLVLEVSDEGSGFDLDACTGDPTTPTNLQREDGRGLFLMRRLMDRVERYNDGGNVVRLVLNRA